MTDKLGPGDVMDLDVINEAMSKLKDYKIKPVDVGVKKYYTWIHDKDGGWIPSDDPGAVGEAFIGA